MYNNFDDALSEDSVFKNLMVMEDKRDTESFDILLIQSDVEEDVNTDLYCKKVNKIQKGTSTSETVKKLVIGNSAEINNFKEKRF